ncbi:MAG: helix-hairpin-helix domain-containing protein [Bacteroidales bacterium]|nr:helix-hairpin-helix domain-containing protein [Bacteroidales bacterium]
MKNTKRGRPSASFVVGSVALIFLIIGYQAALFITKASVARIVANHDHPDTVYVFVDSSGTRVFAGQPLEPGRVHPRFAAAEYGLGSTAAPAAAGVGSPTATRAVEPPELAGEGRSSASKYGKAARDIWRANKPRRYESFRFDPNTVSVDDLMRLGFSQRQAEAIDNYRKKGGRFRRKTDFARSYVVEDSVYKRLEKYIDIPKIDINRADSAAFETLPGIGRFFAAKMVSYRKELGGYSFPEQLMDIWHFDQEKFDGLKDLITVGPCEPYSLWTLPEGDLARHPYIGKRAAKGIIIFRNNTPKADWTVGNIIKAGILDPGLDEKFSRCRIAPPPNP